MLSKIKILTATILSGCLLTIQPAHAGPVLDKLRIINTLSGVTTVQTQLSKVLATLQTIEQDINIQNKIQEAIGKIGANLGNFGTGGTIGSIIGNANMGMSMVMQGKNAYVQFTSSIESMLNNPFNTMNIFSAATSIYNATQMIPETSTPGMQMHANQLNNALSNNLSATNTVGTYNDLMFVNSTTVSDADHYRVQILREMQHRQTIKGAILQSSASLNEIQTSQNTLAATANAATKSKNMRGDIQARSSADLALLEGLDEQNTLLANILRISSSESMLHHQKITGSSLHSSDGQYSR